MAVAHLYGFHPVQSEAPRSPRITVEPEDFAAVAELARSISGCSRSFIRLADPDSGQMRLAFFPELHGVIDLPKALLPDGQGVSRMAGPSLQQEMRAAGLPDLAFWGCFTLRSVEGRVLGEMGVMDEAQHELPETVMAQLAQLSEILSRGVGMAASTIRVMARQTLGLMEDLSEIDADATSPAVMGLLRYAAGRVPTSSEAMAMRIAGLAEVEGGLLLLTPAANGMLYNRGFRLAETPPVAVVEEVVEAASLDFQPVARLRIGEVHHDIARDDATEKFAFRFTGTDDPWVVLEKGLQDGWPEMTAEVIAKTRNATFDYVRMHMIHKREASSVPGEFIYDLYGLEWTVRGTPTHAEARGADGIWRVYDAAHIASDAPRDFSALAAFAAYPDLAQRIGSDVHEWSKRIAAGSEVTPIFG